MAIPQIPKYADSAPAVNENCLGAGNNNGLNIVNPPSGDDEDKGAIVLGGFATESTDLSDTSNDIFRIDHVEYEDVAVALILVTKELTVPFANPILSGTVIDAVECDWSYNAARDPDINIQTLVNSGAGGGDPALTGAERDFDYSSLTIQTNKTVTVTGGDGISQDSDVANITFGNYLGTGVSEPSILTRDPDTDTQQIFDDLNIKTVKTSQAGHNFDAFGTATEFMVIAHPASWGESEFTKGSFTGGYARIYLVNRSGNNIFTDIIEGGDTPLAIMIDNSKNGFTEEFMFYQSSFPARTADKPTIMSKK